MDRLDQTLTKISRVSIPTFLVVPLPCAGRRVASHAKGEPEFSPG